MATVESARPDAREKMAARQDAQDLPRLDSEAHLVTVQPATIAER